MFGAWAFLFVCFLHWQTVRMLWRLLLQQKLHVKKIIVIKKKNHKWEDPFKRDLTIKQNLSDTKLPLFHTHKHTRHPICWLPISHLHGARRMAHFRTVRISCSTRASCSLILYCSSMNSSGLKQQETGTHVTALTLWPRYQPPFFC